MNQVSRIDWRAWRSAIAERLDRQTIGAALAFVLFLVAFSYLTGPGALSDWQRIVRIATLHLIDVSVVLLALTVAMVAVAHGVSRWVAYPLAACIGIIAAAASGLLLDPNNYLVKMTSPRWVAITYELGATILLVPAVVYVIQSNAAQSAAALRRLQIERMTEAERAAHERLQTELATIDHDLVLTAMRLARASPRRAESLLAALSAYLRAAQQRESTDAASVATTLAELRAMCIGPAGDAAQEVTA